MRKITFSLSILIFAFFSFINPVVTTPAAAQFRTGSTDFDSDGSSNPPFPSLPDEIEAFIGNVLAKFKSNEIIVKFKGDRRFTRIVIPSGISLLGEVARFSARSDVEYAEPNFIAKTLEVPNDEFYPFQWHFDNDINGGIGMEEAWDFSNGSGVIIAVIDTGVAYEYYRQSWWRRYYQAPDLADTSFVPGWDFVNGDSHPNDDNSHGTHVAGTLAQSTNNFIGVAGVAHGASLMPLKVLNRYGSGSYADIADAIIWAADNGADVINMSLGGPSPSITLEQALAYAYNQGVTIVAAAGNDEANIVSYPAAYDNYVIAVGATDFNKNLAYYSNYGPSLDIVAPGGDNTADSNNDGYVDGVLQQTFGSSTNDWAYYFFQGTSMASPHVAGVAALIISSGAASTPDEVRTALESTADDLGAAGRDDVFGYGLVNAAAALGWTAGPVDNPPTVSITSPLDGSLLDGVLNITATANDDYAVTNVEFYVNDVLVGSDGTAPYEFSWNSATVPDGGPYTIKARATDTALQTANDTISVTVDNINEQPQITTSPVTSATVDVLYSYDVDATDLDPGDNLTYFLNSPPAGMTIDPLTGLIEWTPSSSQVGDNFVSVSVEDDLGLSDTQEFIVNVADVPLEAVVFEDSFEGGLGSWTQDFQNDWRRSSQRSVDGNYSAEVDGRARDSTLTSLLIDLQGRTNATVDFSWLIERGLDSGEYLAFDVSIDGGASWSEVTRLRGNVDTENVWFAESFEFTGIDSLMLRFRGKMSNSREDADVDMVSVTAW